MDLFSDVDLIIFDLDNTLVFPETCISTKEVLECFKEINQKKQCVILSNSNTASKRKHEIEILFGCDLFLSNNKKPFSSLFKEIDDRYNLKYKNFVVLGDRIFTDIVFGNINNATTILVDPITEREDLFTAVKRFIENALVCILKPLVRKQ